MKIHQTIYLLILDDGQMWSSHKAFFFLLCKERLQSDLHTGIKVTFHYYCGHLSGKVQFSFFVLFSCVFDTLNAFPQLSYSYIYCSLSLPPNGSSEIINKSCTACLLKCTVLFLLFKRPKSQKYRCCISVKELIYTSLRQVLLVNQTYLLLQFVV